ncbi:MAG: hypothetical protein IH605_17260 [Burkholderiales bacterium]|nr:hypothetical protein [Burkholderiales bacterium]
MKPIQRSLLVALALLTGLWLLAGTLMPQPFTYFSFRAAFMQYSGAVAIGAMRLL